MKYFRVVACDELIYSIDMVRFKFLLDKKMQLEFYDFLKTFNSYDCFISQKSFHYRELYKINSADLLFSFAVGIGFNGMKSSDKKLCFLEFNPNKLHDVPELNRVLYFLHSRSILLELVTYDIAVDMPYNKKFVSLVRDKRVYKKHCFDCQGVNVTEYLGQSAESGRVKLYNKMIESNLSYDLTRLELTTSAVDYLVVNRQMPEVLLCRDFDYLSGLKLNKTDYVLLQLLWLSDDPSYYFKQLGRDKQFKLRPFVSSSFFLNFNQDVFDQLLDIVYFFKVKTNFI